MTAIVRVDLGQYVDDLSGRPIVVNGHEVGRTSGQITEAEIQPGWSIIILGHGLDSSAPARFYAYRSDVVQVRAHKNVEPMVPIGGVAGGLYSLVVTHSRPAPEGATQA